MDYFTYTYEGEDISSEFAEKFTQAQNRIITENNFGEFTLSGNIGGKTDATEIHYGSRVFVGILKLWKVVSKKKTIVKIETFISKDKTFYYIDVRN